MVAKVARRGPEYPLKASYGNGCSRSLLFGMGKDQEAWEWAAAGVGDNGGKQNHHKFHPTNVVRSGNRSPVHHSNRRSGHCYCSYYGAYLFSLGLL